MTASNTAGKIPPESWWYRVFQA